MTYLEKIKEKQYAEPLSKDYKGVLMRALTLKTELEPRHISPQERTKVMRVVIKLSDMWKMPIEFTLDGHIALEAICGGDTKKATVALIDVVNSYKNEVVTAKKICALYPHGFYKDAVFCSYVDNVIKRRKVSWSFIF